MNTDKTKKTGVTLMDLIAKGLKKSELKDGIYEAAYIGHVDKKTKLEGRWYFQHSFSIKADGENTTLLVDSGRELKKGYISKYDTKLFKIVTALLGREPKGGETVYLEDLAGLKCKVTLNGDEIIFAPLSTSSPIQESLLEKDA